MCRKYPEDEKDLNDVDDYDSMEWVNAVDRRGLVHVSNATYHVLRAIELEARKHLNVASTRKVEEGYKLSIIDCIVSVKMCYSTDQ